MRSIKKHLKAMKVNMGGIFLEQALPYNDIEQVDPFLLIHHWKQNFSAGGNQEKLGVGPHPHRGFAPVTFVFQGSVHHRDSAGYEDVISAGGTQWMNSGNGIIHSERPGKDFLEKGGTFEIIQFWINAPAKHKMDPPFYQSLTKEQTPSLSLDDNKVKIGVVAGELLGKKSNLETYSPLLILRLEIKETGKIKIPIPENFNALIYTLDGKLTINESTETSTKHICCFNNDGSEIEIEALENSRLILLAGEPINESLATYGPFVMNTQEELASAIQDYQKGKLGQLIETF